MHVESYLEVFMSSPFMFQLDPVGFQDSQDESGLADLSYAFSQRTVPGQEDQSRASAGPQTAGKKMNTSFGHWLSSCPNSLDRLQSYIYVQLIHACRA